MVPLSTALSRNILPVVNSNGMRCVVTNNISQFGPPNVSNAIPLTGNLISSTFCPVLEFTIWIFTLQTMLYVHFNSFNSLPWVHFRDSTACVVGYPHEAISINCYTVRHHQIVLIVFESIRNASIVCRIM